MKDNIPEQEVSEETKTRGAQTRKRQKETQGEDWNLMKRHFIQLILAESKNFEGKRKNVVPNIY